MSVHLSPQAVHDLEGIYVYWAERAGPEVADRLLGEIENRLRVLARFPRAGRNAGESFFNARCLLAGDYLIFYTIVSSRVEVIHVRHGARDLPD